MKVPSWIDVGACTHTGRVRGTNEDDYLLWSPDAGGPFVAAVADGMGGLVGGGEASRIAVRALGVEFAEAGASAGEPPEAGGGGDSGAVALERTMRRAYARAAAGIAERAASSPRLREMGTTLTACALTRTGHFVLGHVGDSRCVLVRGGEVRQWTVDHTVAGAANNLLTRCLGGGRPRDAAREADLRRERLRPGDVVLLVTDGVWNGVPAVELAACVQDAADGGAAGADGAAQEVVERAIRAYGADNATCLVLAYRARSDAGSRRGRSGVGSDGEDLRDREVDLRVAEPAFRPRIPLAQHPLVPPLWPWAGWLFAGLLVAAVAARTLFGVGFRLPG